MAAKNNEKVKKLVALIDKKIEEKSAQREKSLEKKFDQLIETIKATPQMQFTAQIPKTIEVENIYRKVTGNVEVSNFPEKIEVKNTARQVTGSVKVDNFPKKVEVEMKKPVWVKDIQQVEVINAGNKPGWIDSVIAEFTGLLAALMARVASGTIEGLSTLLGGLWRAGIRVRFDGTQKVVIVDQKTGEPIGRGEFGGGGGFVGGGGASKAVKLSLDQYKISDMDDAASPKYYGFIEKDGAWYITKEDTSAKTYRYCKGASNYSTAWTNRATQDYDYFDKIF